MVAGNLASDKYFRRVSSNCAQYIIMHVKLRCGPFQFELMLNIIFVHSSNSAESFRCVRFFPGFGFVHFSEQALVAEIDVPNVWRMSYVFQWCSRAVAIQLPEIGVQSRRSRVQRGSQICGMAFLKRCECECVVLWLCGCVWLCAVVCAVNGKRAFMRRTFRTNAIKL